MASIYISLHEDGGAPRVNVLTLGNGERFMNINITDDCTVSLPGRDHATVRHAVALATAIREAAEALLTTLQDEQHPVVVQ